jgi:hypothetical protein
VEFADWISSVDHVCLPLINKHQMSLSTGGIQILARHGETNLCRVYCRVGPPARLTGAAPLDRSTEFHPHTLASLRWGGPEQSVTKRRPSDKRCSGVSGHRRLFFCLSRPASAVRKPSATCNRLPPRTFSSLRLYTVVARLISACAPISPRNSNRGFPKTGYFKLAKGCYDC